MNSKVTVSAIVPARDEEATIARAVTSLAGQREIAEIIVINDQSSDGTAAVLKELAARITHLRVLETRELPPGWVGKNYALASGAAQATGEWLLFTDADTVHLPGSTGRALADAASSGAALVSYSPEQEMHAWWERAMIPFVYTRLAQRFSFAEVSDPGSPAAAANGQYLLVRRDVYEAIGGHRGIAGEVLEDVALARRAKQAGLRLYFAPGQGIARTRMYRSFGAMWQGWTKNLYPLLGGSGSAVVREFFLSVPWAALLLLLLAPLGQVFPLLGLVLLAGHHAAYAAALRRNHFPVWGTLYYLRASLLYAAAVGASAWSYARGTVVWKGREYRVGTPGRWSAFDRITMVYVTRKIEFSASHLYHNPALSVEENRRIFGKCNNPHGHGHNYVLEVTVAGTPDATTGMVLDLKELKEILQREIIERMDHRFLNYEVPELAGQIPTCENIAATVWKLLEPRITRGRLHRVRLYETPDLFADCYGDGVGR